VHDRSHDWARSRRRRGGLALLAGLSSLGLLACGAETPDGPAGAQPRAGATPATTPPEGGAFPVSVLSGAPDSGEEVTIPARPEAIVSLSPTATETLWAVGAGEQVVAVDDQSDYPAEVPTTDLSGYTPNVEAILGYEPDLVLTAGDDPDLLSGLAAAGVPVLVLPSAVDLEDAYGQVERIGAATGQVAGAAEVVARMQTEIEAAVAAVPERAEPITYFHELDPSLYTVTGETFVGEVYALFGMASIADAAGGDAYPQLSQEYVVEADPDVILLADSQCCDATPATVAERAGWADITAVRTGQVHVLDEDVASRWGPRTLDFAQQVSELLQEREAALGDG
jgi:iron complex transport system substrate-binding protein